MTMTMKVSKFIAQFKGNLWTRLRNAFAKESIESNSHVYGAGEKSVEELTLIELAQTWPTYRLKRLRGVNRKCVKALDNELKKKKIYLTSEQGCCPRCGLRL